MRGGGSGGSHFFGGGVFFLVRFGDQHNLLTRVSQRAIQHRTSSRRTCATNQGRTPLRLCCFFLVGWRINTRRYRSAQHTRARPACQKRTHPAQPPNQREHHTFTALTTIRPPLCPAPASGPAFVVASRGHPRPPHPVPRPATCLRNGCVRRQGPLQHGSFVGSGRWRCSPQ